MRSVSCVAPSEGTASAPSREPAVASGDSARSFCLKCAAHGRFFRVRRDNARRAGLLDGRVGGAGGRGGGHPDRRVCCAAAHGRRQQQRIPQMPHNVGAHHHACVPRTPATAAAASWPSAPPPSRLPSPLLWLSHALGWFWQGRRRGRTSSCTSTKRRRGQYWRKCRTTCKT